MEALQQMRAQALPGGGGPGQERKAQWENGTGWISGSGESTQLQPQVLFGYALAPNTRGHEMEDFHVAEIWELEDGSEDGNEVGLFAIFDSHRGPEVGRELQARLFDNILGEGGVRADPAGAIRDGYLLTDRQLLESSALSGKGGSTAVTAIILDHGSRLIVANVGDSRAVLCKNGVAVQLSVDHDPGRPLQRAEVESRGGVVLTMPGDVARVDGQLALARAFGDKSLKEHMSAKPDMADLLVDLSCEFLVLASNGLWSMFTREEAVDLVKGIADPGEAARSLVVEARRRLCDDDIACVVIRFREL